MNRYETVTITQVRALDGTLHRDRAAAEAHDRYVAGERLEAELSDIVWQATSSYGDLSDYLGDEGWKRDSRLREIVEIIRNKWPDLKAAMESAQ